MTRIAITWTCHIWGCERPNEKISVHSKDVSEEHGLPPGTMGNNVRYCNDRPECAARAVTFKFFKFIQRKDRKT